MVESSRVLLNANSYLASNVAMLWLHNRYGTRDATGQFTPLDPSRIAYRTAVHYAASGNTNPTILLDGLFVGPNNGRFEFTIDAVKQQVFVTLAGEGDKKVKAPLPGPEMFVAGQFVYPPRMLRLLRQRERVGERLADYDLFVSVKPELRPALAEAIVRSNAPVKTK
jgi:hypothetical protein